MLKITKVLNGGTVEEIEAPGVTLHINYEDIFPGIKTVARLRDDEVIYGITFYEQAIRVKLSRKKGRKVYTIPENVRLIIPDLEFKGD